MKRANVPGSVKDAGKALAQKLGDITFIYSKYFIYLFMKNTERGGGTGRGKSRLHAESPTWDLIPGLQDQALG